MAEASGSRQVVTADGASGREGQPVHAAKSRSWLGKVFEFNPAGLNWPHAVLFLDVALVPLVIFWAIGHEEYLLSALFGVLFTGSVGAITLTIVVTTGLWERSPHPAAREQVALFNIVTAVTVGLGVAALYLALFIAVLAAALLLVPGNLLGQVLGHPAGVADEVTLAWLAASIATLGGALGAALETRETVREAAYTYQPDAQLHTPVDPA
jgi:hypothetical protein